ncbi:MAG: hypothetical protein C0518_10480 [Opitutus sp.]|nr:hypothetical protein [Opitutus sp.]
MGARSASSIGDHAKIGKSQPVRFRRVRLKGFSRPESPDTRRRRRTSHRAPRKRAGARALRTHLVRCCSTRRPPPQIHLGWRYDDASAGAAGMGTHFRAQPLRRAGQHLRCEIAVSAHTGGMKAFLVPVDFSAVTDEVVDTAVTFARAFEGKVTLIHVVQPPVVTSEFALPVEVLQEAVTAGEKAAKAKLETLVELFRNAGIACEMRVAHGPPVTLIREEAERMKADYIIMGSHGHGKLYDFLVGSTASGVMKKAKCGLIIVPPTDKAS